MAAACSEHENGKRRFSLSSPLLPPSFDIWHRASLVIVMQGRRTTYAGVNKILQRRRQQQVRHAPSSPISFTFLLWSGSSPLHFSVAPAIPSPSEVVSCHGPCHAPFTGHFKASTYSSVCPSGHLAILSGSVRCSEKSRSLRRSIFFRRCRSRARVPFRCRRLSCLSTSASSSFPNTVFLVRRRVVGVTCWRGTPPPSTTSQIQSSRSRRN